MDAADPLTTAFHEVCYYTLGLNDPRFIHQHVIDAWFGQTTRTGEQSIALTFALAGLYLHVDKGYTGKQVQLAHMKIARHKPSCPDFEIPADRGSITAIEVAASSPGSERDQLISKWCESVWSCFSTQRQRLQSFLQPFGLD